MSFDFRHRDYSVFNYRTLENFEKFLLGATKDSTLTRKEQANARKELKRVRAAMKTK